MLAQSRSLARTTIVRVLLIAALACALPGCGTLYLTQAAAGELHVLSERRPIDSVVLDRRTPEEVRESLFTVREAREFASRVLKLPDNGSYRTYANIRRPYVVWNVVAAPQFSVEPKRWCFPIAGCVAYRGYFSQKKARAFAAGLSERGYDVMVGGVAAYSTLGRFSDPVLSTMVDYGDTQLAAMIFHELAHQLLYVKNDSEFNEAFAMTVEAEGVKRWLRQHGQQGAFAAYLRSREQERKFVDLFARARVKLAKLYASGIAVDEMRSRKARIFSQLAEDVRALEHRLEVHSSVYDEWLASGLNNADVASLATYYDCMPGFERLLAGQGDDLQAFYAAAGRLAKRPRRERHRELCSNPEAAAPP